MAGGGGGGGGGARWAGLRRGHSVSRGTKGGVRHLNHSLWRLLPRGYLEGAPSPPTGTAPSPRPAPPRPGKVHFLQCVQRGSLPRAPSRVGCQLHRLLQAGRAGREDPTPSERESEQERVPGGGGAQVPSAGRAPPAGLPTQPLCPTPALHQGLGCPRLGSLPRPAPSARLPSRRGHPRGDGVWVGAADVPMAQERRRRWVSRWPGPRARAPGGAHLDLGGRGRGRGGRARVLPSRPCGSSRCRDQAGAAAAGQRCSPAPRRSACSAGRRGRVGVFLAPPQRVSRFGFSPPPAWVVFCLRRRAGLARRGPAVLPPGILGVLEGCGARTVLSQVPGLCLKGAHRIPWS